MPWPRAKPVMLDKAIQSRAAGGKRVGGTLEHVPLLRNRNMLWIHGLAHVLVGEPVSTSPEHALATADWGHKTNRADRARRHCTTGLGAAGRGDGRCAGFADGWPTAAALADES